MDYGLILTWSVTLNSSDFACDAIFVYKETTPNEILMENMPVIELLFSISTIKKKIHQTESEFNPKKNSFKIAGAL